MTYKIIIEDRSYKTWHLIDTKTLVPVLLPGFDPIVNHLFSNDTFEYDFITSKLDIIHSSTRNIDNIPAILVLADNKTYGRHPTNKKLLYKLEMN